MRGMEDEAVAELRRHPGGLTLNELRTRLINRGVQVAPGTLEAVLLLSGRVGEHDGRWRRRGVSRAEMVLETLAQYAAVTGRSLFRAENALQELPIEQRPTIDELAQILLQTSDFELLKNNMIRKKG